MNIENFVAIFANLLYTFMCCIVEYVFYTIFYDMCADIHVLCLDVWRFNF